MYRNCRHVNLTMSFSPTHWRPGKPVCWKWPAVFHLSELCNDTQVFNSIVPSSQGPKGMLQCQDYEHNYLWVRSKNLIYRQSLCKHELLISNAPFLKLKKSQCCPGCRCALLWQPRTTICNYFSALLCAVGAQGILGNSALMWRFSKWQSRPLSVPNNNNF